jgi:hypothetical protein
MPVHEVQAEQGAMPVDEVQAMLDKMESAMRAMELAMQSAMRAGGQAGSDGERDALVARVQTELRTVMGHLPPAVRERISPTHPTMFRTLTQDLDAERRAFIENWADGVRKHGRDFEAWVRTHNQGDSEFRFLIEPASADARYYQGCITGMVVRPHTHAEANAGSIAGAPATGAQLEHQRRHRSTAKSQNVFQRLASPPRANVQKISGRLRSDGAWSPRAVPSSTGVAASGTARSRLTSPRRTTARASLSRRQKLAEDEQRHRARLASPPRAKAQSPARLRRSPPRSSRSRDTGVGGRGGNSAREQALVERLSSPSRGIRSKVTSPSRTRSAWIISAPGTTGDIGAPDLHSLEQLGEMGMASTVRGDGTGRSSRKPSARRGNNNFAEDQASWTERREAKLRQQRLALDHQREQERLKHEEDRVLQQQQRARRRVALGVDSSGKQETDFTERSQAWQTTRQQTIEKKRRELENLSDAGVVTFKPNLSKKSKQIARGMASLTDRLDQIEKEKRQKLEEARRQKQMAEEKLCMQPPASVVASRAKSKLQRATKEMVAAPASPEQKMGENDALEDVRVQAELERAEAEYRALEEEGALELELEEELEQEDMFEQKQADISAPAETKPERPISAAALIGAKVRAAGGKMLSLQQELGELKDEISSVQLAGTPVASPATTARGPSGSADPAADDPFAEIEAMGLGTASAGADDPFVQLAAMNSAASSCATEDAFAELQSLVS